MELPPLPAGAAELSGLIANTEALNLPELPKNLTIPLPSDAASLPALPWYAQVTQGGTPATNAQSGQLATSAADIVDRVSAGKRVSTTIQPEFRRRKAEAAPPLKQEQEFLAMLPPDVKPLAALLHETLSLFPDEELDELLSGWDWKSRHLVQKLSK